LKHALQNAKAHGTFEVPKLSQLIHEQETIHPFLLSLPRAFSPYVGEGVELIFNIKAFENIVSAEGHVKHQLFWNPIWLDAFHRNTYIYQTNTSPDSSGELSSMLIEIAIASPHQ